MNKDLYNWLEKEWRFNNHIKYQKYFREMPTILVDPFLRAHAIVINMRLNIMTY